MDSQDPSNDEGWQEVSRKPQSKRSKASVRPQTSAANPAPVGNRFVFTHKWMCSIQPGERFGSYQARQVPVVYPHGLSIAPGKKTEIEDGIRRLFRGDHLDIDGFKLMRDKCFLNQAEPYMVISCRYNSLHFTSSSRQSSTGGAIGGAGPSRPGPDTTRNRHVSLTLIRFNGLDPARVCLLSAHVYTDGTPDTMWLKNAGKLHSEEFKSQVRSAWFMLGRGIDRLPAGLAVTKVRSEDVPKVRQIEWVMFPG